MSLLDVPTSVGQYSGESGPVLHQGHISDMMIKISDTPVCISQFTVEFLIYSKEQN